MGKAYCPKCRRILDEVFSGFECLAIWDKVEKFYIPGNSCNLVKRCPACGSLTREKKERIGKKMKRGKEEEGLVSRGHT